VTVGHHPATRQIAVVVQNDTGADKSLDALRDFARSIGCVRVNLTAVGFHYGP
jgi:hypothetical protein